MLVNIERARNANHTLRRVLLCERLPFKQVLQLPGADVISRLFFLFRAAPGTEVAAVAGNKLPAIAEPVHRQHAAVVAALAAEAAGYHFERLKRSDIKFRCGQIPHLHLFTRDQSAAIGSHQTGNIRAKHGLPEMLLQDSEQCVIQEGSALHNHMVAELFSRTETEHFVKRVADH